MTLTQAQSHFDAYAGAFARRDMGAIAAMWQYPCFISDPSGGAAFRDADAFRRNLDRLSGLLRPGGCLMFATMARESFTEWRAAHASHGLTAGTPLYPDMATLRAMLARHADAFLFDEEYVLDFGGARGLLAHLKGIGATVPVEGRAPLSAGQLRQVMRSHDRAGGNCTYHVAYCRVTRL
ncbi:MAG: hypothetical protein B7Z20_01590 [Sphingobium sp. 32-64-5]|nr:MAG: hypothetical protein B7Z20_01590 [Sphingobium sp. 32-64-5]